MWAHSAAIQAGTEVWVFPIEEAPTGDRCYSNALWNPLLFPLHSEYNDYGGGENTHQDVAYSYLMDVLQEIMVEHEVGENQYHDIAVKRDDLGEELFFEAVHEGRLQISGVFSKSTDVDFVMVRKDVVDEIIQTYQMREYIGWNDEDQTAIYQNYTFSDVFAQIPEIVKHIEFKQQQAKKNGTDILFKHFSPGEFVNTVCEDLHDKTKNHIWKVTGNMFRVGRDLGNLSTRMSDLFFNTLAHGNTDTLEAILERLLTGSVVSKYMNEIRGIWVPACHEGSQAADWDAYKHLAGLLNTVADRELAEYDE